MTAALPGVANQRPDRDPKNFHSTPPQPFNAGATDYSSGDPCRRRDGLIQLQDLPPWRWELSDFSAARRHAERKTSDAVKYLGHPSKDYFQLLFYSRISDRNDTKKSIVKGTKLISSEEARSACPAFSNKEEPPHPLRSSAKYSMTIGLLPSP